MLWEAGRALAAGLTDGDLDHDAFNESLLCCLPKKAGRTTEDGEGVFEPGETRPLSITNTDNRLIANAYRLRWEPIIAPGIAREQRGFIQGRSMLANVVDIEHAAMTASMECEEAVIVLFDFSAAFPSVSRRYLLTMARAAGFPAMAMEVLGALYHQTVGQLLLHGRLHEHVRLDSGIRQGCPLSPLLFAMASDSLLRIMAVRHPLATTRAFADDTAMVLRSWRAEQRRVFATFRTFESVSNLALNLSKTCVIPLWAADIQQLQADTAAAPDEEHITWATSGKYLGYYVGPGKSTQSWDKPLAKYKSRLRDWQWSDMGLHTALGTYNVYVLPVLLFIAQLEIPPTRSSRRRRRQFVASPRGLATGACRRTSIMGAPWAWRPSCGLWRFRAGQPCCGRTPGRHMSAEAFSGDAWSPRCVRPELPRTTRTGRPFFVPGSTPTSPPECGQL